MQELGTLERIDAREVWTHEAHDFTPWLQENIALLGAALQLDLDLVESEVKVGPFAADLVAKDVSHDRWVVIENQLEATDHSHLGQLLTYGAGLDNEAAVFVWISPDFRDEHRAAMDWLNEHSDEESLFFGVAIELLKIDDSSPAPNFRLVSYPNDWKKSGGSSRSPVSQKGAAYEQFFGGLLSRFKERYPGETNVAKASAQNWLTLSIGKGGFGTGWSFASEGRFRGQFRVELFVDTGDAEVSLAYFEQLRRSSATIEETIGHALDWEAVQGRRVCRAYSHYEESVSISSDDATLLAVEEWAVDEMKSLRDAFRPHIQDLRGDASPNKEP